MFQDSILFKIIYEIFNSNFLQMSMSKMFAYLIKHRAKNQLSISSKYWKRLKMWKFFMYLYLSVLILRLWILGYVLKEGHDKTSIVDPLMGFVALHLKIFDFYTSFVLSPLPFFALYMDYLLFFKLDISTIYLMNDIMLNSKHFFTYNPKFIFISFQIISPFKWIFVNLKTLQMVWYCTKDEIHFYQPKMKYFPFVSNQIRARSVILSFVIERIIIVILVLLCK